MMMNVAYDPNQAPGTVGTDETGQPVTYLSAEEFFPLQLGYVINATAAFVNIAASSDQAIPQEDRRKADDAIADWYWNKYQGMLLPPPILRALDRGAKTGPADAYWALIEKAKERLLDPNATIDALESVRALLRVEALLQGADGVMTDLQTAIAEAMIDLFFLQRGAMEDIRRAEQTRGPGQLRADLLDAWDETGDTVFDECLEKLSNPQAIKSAIPAARRADVEAFSARRTPFYRTGVFFRMPGGAS